MLAHLVRWVAQPRFMLRHRWAEGTVAMWDNPATQHFVVNDFEGEGVIQRVTVMGDKPHGATPHWEPALPGRLSAVSRHYRKLANLLRHRPEDD